MKTPFLTTMLCTACTVLLAACGGGISFSFGDFDEPRPINATAVVTVTSATLAGQNGVYGGAALGLSAVEKVSENGGFSCVFSFNNLINLNRPAGSAGTLSGRVRYRENASSLSRLEVTISGEPYAAVYPAAGVAQGAPENGQSQRDVQREIEREADRVVFSDRQLASISSVDTSTLVVSGTLPMRSSRPPGC